jgi:hypothetical protein
VDPIYRSNPTYSRRVGVTDSKSEVATDPLYRSTPTHASTHASTHAHATPTDRPLMRAQSNSRSFTNLHSLLPSGVSEVSAVNASCEIY